MDGAEWWRERDQARKKENEKRKRVKDKAINKEREGKKRRE